MTRRGVGSLALSILLVGGVGALRGGPAEGVEVRVLVAEADRALSVGSPADMEIRDLESRERLLVLPSGRSASLAMLQGQFFLDGRPTPARLLRLLPRREAPAQPYVMVEGQLYRGQVEVRPTPEGRLVAINVLDLEEYLWGVIAQEIDPRWPIEALKAQAVVARTYALYQIRHTKPGVAFHLRATTASQVYAGIRGEDSRTVQAVTDTAGQILTYRGDIISAFYHACSGGHTEDAEGVFGMQKPFLVGVPDRFGLGCPHDLWQESVPLTRIQEALAQGGVAVDRITALVPVGASRSGRVRVIEIYHAGGRLGLPATQFRRLLGPDLLRSTHFTVRVEKGMAIFVGKGWGHGVGLSQWGAKGMAELAYSYVEILKTYYPQVDIIALGTGY